MRRPLLRAAVFADVCVHGWGGAQNLCPVTTRPRWAVPLEEQTPDLIRQK